MKKRLKAAACFIAIGLIIYPFGMILALVFLTMRKLKYIKVLNWEKFPHFKEKVILVANHPSMLDPFLMASLCFWGYAFRPFKFGPLLVSDKSIFYDSWKWFWLRPFLIPVDRGDRRAEAASFLKIKDALNQGKRVIIFPEGGRTFRGDNFLYSKNGKKIRTFKTGIGLLVAKTQALVVPVWIDGTSRALPNSEHKLFTRFRFRKRNPIIVKIGDTLNFQSDKLKKITNREEITHMIASSLLELADQEI